MSDNTLTIKGSTKHEEETKKGDYFRREMSSGSFARSIALLAEVDGSKTKATFKNGILELTLPKLATAKRRKITVS